MDQLRSFGQRFANEPVKDGVLLGAQLCAGTVALVLRQHVGQEAPLPRRQSAAAESGPCALLDVVLMVVRQSVWLPSELYDGGPLHREVAGFLRFPILSSES